MPATTPDVEALFFGPDGIATFLRPGTIVVDQTSGDPVAARVLAGRPAEQGVAMVYAPVSGGPEGARAGTIVILVCADKGTVPKVLPILKQISVNVIQTGDFGIGYVAKLTNNLLFSATRLMTFEAVAMAVKNGLAPEKFVEILS